jgi:hypothetical protein
MKAAADTPLCRIIVIQGAKKAVIVRKFQPFGRWIQEKPLQMGKNSPHSTLPTLMNIAQ